MRSQGLTPGSLPRPPGLGNRCTSASSIGCDRSTAKMSRTPRSCGSETGLGVTHEPKREQSL